ncbi:MULTISPECIES: TfuA-like protein [Actinomycetes]|uniref:TfuA-like protein n=1 Tax=Actinomycetes TaxID=1760 RepID=UPI0001B566D3|nr:MULTISPECIES: TfuA-like protein [Actinomycetes]EFL12568.1 hypothetical protein SSMG_08239 [Streptomyces sp. AA4]
MIHVFVGPTIGEKEVRGIVGEVAVHRPIKHGDLFAPDIASGDTVLVLDGLYHQSLSLRHKEVFHALDNGVRVVGASSVGALRAADLARFGMIGIGEIYRAYASGEIVGDDEVAVAHGSDDDLSALTVPLVNIRAVLRAAAAEHVIPAAEQAALLELFRQLYYPQRTFRTCLRWARKHGREDFADWWEAKTRDERHFGNQKRADAIAALTWIQETRDWQESSGERVRLGDWHTGFYRDWRNHFAGFAEDSPAPLGCRIQYQQIFNPAFPDIWAGFLARLSRSPAGQAEGQELAQRFDALGIGESARGRAPFVDQVQRTIFRPRYDLGDSRHVRWLLAGETPQDIATLTEYLAADREFHARNPAFSSRWLRRDVGSALLADLWGVDADEMEGAGVARGFRSEGDAVRALARMVVGYLTAVRAFQERKTSAHAG